MLVILKIPVVYLGAVVCWAIRAEPRPREGVIASVSREPTPPCDWHARLRGRVSRPRPSLGGRAPARRVALLRAEVRS